MINIAGIGAIRWVIAVIIILLTKAMSRLRIVNNIFLPLDRLDSGALAAI